MIKQPLVSIIIPFYNHFGWLKEALRSVLDQTYKNYEIILIDDGSKGNFKKYLDIKNPKIRYFKQKNQGAAKARNLGLEKSKGEYIAFLDADDLFLPGKIAKQVKLMERYPSAILSHTSYSLIQNKKPQSIVHSGKFQGRVYPKIIYRCPIATPTVMLKKDGIKNLKFPERIKFGEDVIFWTEISKRSQILAIDKALTRVRKTSSSASDNLDKKITGFSNITNYFLKNNVQPYSLRYLTLIIFQKIYLGLLFLQKRFINHS